MTSQKIYRRFAKLLLEKAKEDKVHPDDLLVEWCEVFESIFSPEQWLRSEFIDEYIKLKTGGKNGKDNKEFGQL